MISVVSVSYFGSADLAELVSSLRAQTHGEWSLTVVDNSTDATEQGALSALLDGTPGARLLVPPENLGYLGGVRWALEHSAAPPAWTVICNADVAFGSPSALARLAAISDASIGVLAPAIRTPGSHADQNPFLRARPSLMAQRRRRLQLATPAIAQASLLVAHGLALASGHRAARSSPQGVTQIYAAHGSAFALSSRYFDAGGNLDHPLFLFGEELYVAEQCRRVGLSVTYVPDVAFVHRNHSGTGVLRQRPILKMMVESGRYGVELLYGGPNA